MRFEPPERSRTQRRSFYAKQLFALIYRQQSSDALVCC